VTGSRGNNLHDVTLPDGTTFLASMPTKFRRNVWVKRGDFVVVVPIEEGDKVKAEVARILYHDQIRYIRANNRW
jgi:probable RNA-binding protein EIF1AD